eukprot:8455987-Pyramimonas_sp.AAC.1
MPLEAQMVETLGCDVWPSPLSELTVSLLSALPPLSLALSLVPLKLFPEVSYMRSLSRYGLLVVSSSTFQTTKKSSA